MCNYRRYAKLRERKIKCGSKSSWMYGAWTMWATRPVGPNWLAKYNEDPFLSNLPVQDIIPPWKEFSHKTYEYWVLGYYFNSYELFDFASIGHIKRKLGESCKSHEKIKEKKK